MGVISHNPLKFFRPTVLGCLAAIAGCGPSHTGNPPRPDAGRVPDRFSRLPSLQTVTDDSLDLLIYRDASGPGPALISFDTAPGVMPSFTLLGFDGPKELTQENNGKPVLVHPPYALTARGSRDGDTGAEVMVTDAGRPEYGGGVEEKEPSRLPQPALTSAPQWNVPSDIATFNASDTFRKTVRIDGQLDEQDTKTRSYTADALFDVPYSFGAIDLRGMDAVELSTGYRVALLTRGEAMANDTRVYGFEIGPSGIKEDVFGSGTNFVYKVEIRAGVLRVLDQEADKDRKLSADATFAIGDIIEIYIPREDLPLLDDAEHLAVRPFALDWSLGINIVDRMEPTFLRSPFAMLRSATSLPGNRQMSVDFHLPSSLAGGDFGDDYFRMMASMLPSLEANAGIPFYRTGSFPLFYVPNEDRGYAGLNTTDRGTLTTLGPGTSLVSKAQLMAHEIAHLMNARSSQIKDRWMQEAHSEWVAERVISDAFPTRAVYKFMRDLRFDRYFDLVEGNDDFPLASWSSDTSAYGYEKSILFLNLLEQVVGTEALRDVYRESINVAYNSELLQERLAWETGEDLEELFTGWVFAGDFAPRYLPEAWFADEDQDGLVVIDEKALGTSDTDPDTDRDGFLDGEEYFDRRDPLVNEDGTSGLRLAGLSNASTTDLMRVGGSPGKTVEWTAVVGSGVAGLAPYTQPEFFLPPWQIDVREDDGEVMTLDRPFYKDGSVVAMAPAAENFYPTTVLSAVTLSPDLVSATAGTIIDSPLDVPTPFAMYNIVSWEVASADAAFTVTIQLAEEFDPLNFRGEFSVVFDTVSWSGGLPVSSREYSLIYDSGTLYGKGADDEKSEVVASGFSYNGDVIKIVVAEDALGDWATTTEEQHVCLWSESQLDGRADGYREHAGCHILTTPGYNRYSGTISDHFGIGFDHFIDLMIEAGDDTGDYAATIRATAASGVRAFEEILGRPLLDRQVWPLHAHIITSGSTSGAADQLIGGYLSGRSNLWDDRYLYLVIEEMARLHMTDLVSRHGETPFWLQETYIQWLAGGAAYRILPTSEVIDFHDARIDQYFCYVQQMAGCTDLYTADIPLSEWNSSQSGTTGSIRSLMFLLVLNATVGTEELSEVFSAYTNKIPSSEQLKAALKSREPGASAAIDDLWTVWVDGSGDLNADQASIASHFVDADGDDLFLVEEQIRGSDDSVADAYP